MGRKDNLKYIDCHVHITPRRFLRRDSYELYLRGKKQAPWVLERVTKDPEFFVRMLDEASVERAFLIGIASPDIEGMPFDYNDFLHDYAKSFPDRLFPIASIHPRLTRDAKRDFEYLIDKLGMKGIKIHPPHQLVYPNDYLRGNKSLGTIYSMAQERRVPVIIHTGTSIFAKARNIYGDPLYVDDIAVDYPDLKIVLAHGGRPLWMKTAFFLVRRHKNVYMDVSGIPPSQLLDYFPRLDEIADKTMFGTDWAGPLVPGIKENISAFLRLPLSEGVKMSILRHTALKVF